MNTDLNKQILDLVDEKIQALEADFQQLDDLVAKKSVLSQRLIEATSAEHRALNNPNLSEEQAVAAIAKAHSFKEVTAARLAQADRSIAAQKHSITAGTGFQARKYASEVAQQFADYELKVALALVEENFARHPENESLARRSKRFVESERLSYGVSVYTLEHESLRDLRANFVPVTAACASAVDLQLTLPESWLATAKPTLVDLAKAAQLSGKLTADQDLLLAALAKDPNLAAGFAGPASTKNKLGKLV
jgi:hypothetical protein